MSSAYSSGNSIANIARRVLILSTTPALTRNAVWAAGLCGLKCDVVTDFAGASWCRQAHVGQIIQMPRRRVAEMDASLLEDVMGRFSSDYEGILTPVDTPCTRHIGGIRDSLPKGMLLYPIPDLRQFDELYDKWRFFEVAKRIGLPQPQSYRITSSELPGATLPYPVLVKPAWGEGSFGFKALADERELREHLSTLKPSEETPFLIQEYLPGEDIDMSLMSDHGRIVAWAIQQRMDNAIVNFLEHDQVYALAERFVAETAYHGVMHLDMRIDERNGRVHIIEANPRFWGSLCYATWVGVNFLEVGLRLALGELPSEPVRARLGACPYLGVSRRSLPHLLVGGKLVPRSVPRDFRDCWRFHHAARNGGLRAWFEEYVARRPT